MIKLLFVIVAIATISSLHLLQGKIVYATQYLVIEIQVIIVPHAQPDPRSFAYRCIKELHA